MIDEEKQAFFNEEGQSLFYRIHATSKDSLLI